MRHNFCPNCGNKVTLIEQPDESGVPPDVVIGERCAKCGWKHSLLVDEKRVIGEALRGLKSIEKKLEDML